MAVELNDMNFQDEVLNAKGVTLVDFWAPWCGPCKRQLPIVEELSEEITIPNAKVAKMNVDENSQMAVNYQISSVPTLLVFKEGKVVERMSGLHSKDQLKDVIQKHS